MTALMRSLNKLTQVGLLARDAPAVEAVAARFSDVEQLRAARLHPLNILVAMRTYARGHGDKGKLTWEPNPQIVAALERAFYGSFSLVVPTGKRFVLALDVSGSMGQSISGMGISCAEAATAMAMATVRTEPMCRTMAFGHEFPGSKFILSLLLGGWGITCGAPHSALFPCSHKSQYPFGPTGSYEHHLSVPPSSICSERPPGNRPRHRCGAFFFFRDRPTQRFPCTERQGLQRARSRKCRPLLLTCSAQVHRRGPFCLAGS